MVKELEKSGRRHLRLLSGLRKVQQEPREVPELQLAMRSPCFFPRTGALVPSVTDWRAAHGKCSHCTNPRWISELRAKL